MHIGTDVFSFVWFSCGWKPRSTRRKPHIQHVPPYTKTDVCLSLIGKMPPNFHIDERKLVFVGQICCLAADHVLRSIFCYGLVSYYGPFAHNCPQLGFIPSITQLLRKYSLEYFIFNFMQSGQFPPKNAWKKLVCQAVRGQAEREWQCRVSSRVILMVSPV